jgi:hypothetical protein
MTDADIFVPTLRAGEIYVIMRTWDYYKEVAADIIGHTMNPQEVRDFLQGMVFVHAEYLYLGPGFVHEEDTYVDADGTRTYSGQAEFYTIEIVKSLHTRLSRV